MSDDFSLFKQADGSEPLDGVHTARLEGAVVLDTKNGRRVKLTWQTTDYAHYWESWHGVTGRAKAFTKDTLNAIGVDLDAVGSWAGLADELALREGKVFRVQVERNGDWLNTSVLADAKDEQLDLPVDTGGLPAAGAAAKAGGGMFDDEPPF